MSEWNTVFLEQRGDHSIYRHEAGESYHYRITYRHKYVGAAFTMPEVNRIITANNNALDIEHEFFSSMGVDADKVKVVSQ